MKNKTGKIIGFALGVVSFLLLFKVIFLVNIPPEDELAPGVVMLAAVLNGLLFALAGNLIQNCLSRKRTS